MDPKQTASDDTFISASELADFEQKTETQISGLRKNLEAATLKSQKLASELSEVSERLDFFTEIMDKVNVTIFINQITDIKKGTWELKWASNYYEEMLGFSQEEVKAKGTEKHQMENWHQDDFKQLGNYHKWKMKNGNANGIYRRRHKDGSMRWIYITAKDFMHNEKGEATEIMGVAIDLTDEIQTKEQLAIVLRENLQLRNKLIVNCLTSREKQILNMIGEGLTNRQIADDLNLSVHTIDSHRKNLLSKLDLKNTAELIKLAAESGLV